MKVSVTKSRPAQHVGLTVEEQDNNIIVTDVYGIFKENDLPVHIGDQVLEVNGTPVTSKEGFPRGLKDIQMFLRREWHICVLVKKGPNALRDEATETEPVKTHGIVAKETKKWNSYNRDDDDSDSEHSFIDLSDEEGDEVTRCRTTRRAKNRRMRCTRSLSPYSLHTRDDKRRGRKKELPAPVKASWDVSLSDATVTTVSNSTDDDTPPRNEDRTCQTGTLVDDIDENDNTVVISPLSPDRATKPKSEGLEIKSIHGSDHGITLELDNGKIVSITPEQLLAAVSEHKALGDSLTSLTKNESNSSGMASTKEEDEPDVLFPRRRSYKLLQLPEEPPRSPSNPIEPSVSSINNMLNVASVRMSLSKLLLQHKDSTDTRDEHSACSSGMSVVTKTPPSKKFMRKLRNAPKAKRRSSMPTIGTESLHETPLMSIREGEHLMESPKTPKKTKKKKKRRSSKPPEILPDEPSLHSTHTCLVNLIDPGDLMKICGFKAKAAMNGATVEVIRKSKGHDGKRWDVKVISKKHIENSSFDAKRLISVSKDNLKHFR